MVADGVEVPQLNENSTLQWLTPFSDVIDWKREFPTLANSESPEELKRVPHDFRGADLRGADLRGSDFSTDLFFDANLEGADLRGANLKGAWFGGAILRDANLQGCDFEDAMLGRADLRGANFGDTVFTATNFAGANLRGANFALSKIGLSTFARASLDEANFEGAVAWMNIFERASLKDSQFGGARIWGGNFRGCDLQGANLGHADLAGADLRRANLHGANLRGAKLITGFATCDEFCAVDIFDHGYLYGKKARGLAVDAKTGADLEGANFRNADFGGLIQVGAARVGDNLREIQLWSSALGGAVVAVGHLAFRIDEFRRYVAARSSQMPQLETFVAQAEGRQPAAWQADEILAAIDFLESRIPLVMRRKAHELGVLL